MRVLPNHSDELRVDAVVSPKGPIDTVFLLGSGIAQTSWDSALDAIARQPDASDRISRTLFVGLAMIESLAIYSLVISLIILLANPFLSLISGH